MELVTSKVLEEEVKPPLSIPKVFFGYCLVFFLSWISFNIPFLEPFFFFSAIAGFTYLTWKKVEWGIYLIFAELFVGSFGYLFSFHGLSLRISLFIIFLSIFLYRLFQKRKIYQLLITNYQVWFLTALLLWLGISFLRGAVAYGFSAAFSDFNGYLFFVLAIPILLNNNNSEHIMRVELRPLLTLLFGALIFLFALSSIIEFLFARFGFVHEIYVYIRDRDIGEVTNFLHGFVRIFLQSDIYAVLGILVGAAGMFVAPRAKIRKYAGIFFVSCTVLLLSASRSFWLGSAMALGLLGVTSLQAYGLARSAKTTAHIFGLAALSFFFVMLISGAGPAAQTRALGQRFTLSEPALSARGAQLQPLLTGISEHTILGHGFGKTLTYISTDPRRIAQSVNGTGITTTSAFELGWLDLWLKTGIIGIMTLCTSILSIWYGLNRMIQRAGGITRMPPLHTALLFTIPALIIIHLFTPYLNHPLGIGILLLAAIASPQKTLYHEL